MREPLRLGHRVDLQPCERRLRRGLPPCRVEVDSGPLLAALWVLAGAAIVSVIILLRDAWRE